MAALMIQGCGSDVGKSLLVAGLCRAFGNRGIVVRPFKPQNMSNNAAVTQDGGEIGRSTALQAFACRTAASVDMNPILLKPQSEIASQLVVRGRRVGVLQAAAHMHDKRNLLETALASYRRVRAEAQLVLVEGAGSPAETNLRVTDIANMGFAHAADVPVVLVGDIHRGHVIAALVGAHAVLAPEDRARVRGFIVNKFRGDTALFAGGLREIEKRTGWGALGLVPWLPAAATLPAEDAMQLEEPQAPDAAGAIRIVIPKLPHIANFDDFDPLRHEPHAQLDFVAPGRPLPLDAALIILPGSKATIADLEFFRAQGWHIDLLAHLRRGGRVLGICAGYQMLGTSLADPLHIEGNRASCAGLGLLDIATTMTAQKTLRTVSGIEQSTGARLEGYEMHIGVSSGPDTHRPMLRLDDGANDGAMSSDGRVAGCHVHGLFASAAFRAAYLASLGVHSTGMDHTRQVDRALDEIAAALERSLDLDALLRLASAV